MARSQLLVNSLKKLLKSRKLTYRQLAFELGLSEASLKRSFALANFTLARLDQICLLLDIELSDLARMAEAEVESIQELSEAQEAELVADRKLLLVAFLVINGWSYAAILQDYSLSEPELIRCLVALEKLKLIELQLHNRIKLRTSSHFAWRQRGPILKFFAQHLKQDFFEANFQAENEAIIFAPGILSLSSCRMMQQKIAQLACDFNVLNQQDAGLPEQQRSVVAMVVGLRPWKPKAFAPWRRS